MKQKKKKNRENHFFFSLFPWLSLLLLCYSALFIFKKKNVFDLFPFHFYELIFTHFYQLLYFYIVDSFGDNDCIRSQNFICCVLSFLSKNIKKKSSEKNKIVILERKSLKVVFYTSIYMHAMSHTLKIIWFRRTTWCVCWNGSYWSS